MSGDQCQLPTAAVPWTLESGKIQAGIIYTNIIFYQNIEKFCYNIFKKEIKTFSLF